MLSDMSGLVASEAQSEDTVNSEVRVFEPFAVAQLANGMFVYIMDSLTITREVIHDTAAEGDENGDTEDYDVIEYIDTLTVTENSNLAPGTGAYITPGGCPVNLNWMISGKSTVETIRVGFLAKNLHTDLLKIISVPVESVSMLNADTLPDAPLTIPYTLGEDGDFETGLVYINMNGEQIGAQVISVVNSTMLRVLFHDSGDVYSKLVPIDAVYLIDEDVLDNELGLNFEEYAEDVESEDVDPEEEDDDDSEFTGEDIVDDDDYQVDEEMVAHFAANPHKPKPRNA